MQNDKVTVSTILLVVLALVIGVAIGLMVSKNKKVVTQDEVVVPVTTQTTSAVQQQPATTTAVQPQPVPPVVASTSYTYKDHGFTIELPKGFTPVEQKSEGGPAISISLPNNSHLSYVTNASFWEQYTIPSYQFVKNEKIGETTFKVYSYNNGTKFYWYKQGNVGYEFSGDVNLLKTFKFVGWAN